MEPKPHRTNLLRLELVSRSVEASGPIHFRTDRSRAELSTHAYSFLGRFYSAYKGNRLPRKEMDTHLKPFFLAFRRISQHKGLCMSSRRKGLDKG